ncbi:MAG: hypothetical protein JW947_05325 [Sedimentisphaerales bacterium]|nr:hypothetical protein [Sedimentisphaerales bacterium]
MRKPTVVRLRRTLKKYPNRRQHEQIPHEVSKKEGQTGGRNGKIIKFAGK